MTICMALGLSKHIAQERTTGLMRMESELPSKTVLGLHEGILFSLGWIFVKDDSAENVKEQ